MKTKLLIICLSLIGLLGASCQEDEFDMQSPNVDQFISILKSGNYLKEVGFILPDFSEKHIERLLLYTMDTTNVEGFPSNPVSSKYTNPKRLSECLFWTIDGIRLGNKYPSLEPCLIDTTTYSQQTGYIRVSGKKLEEISGWYNDWYNEYKKNPTEEMLKKNLFENTSYKWN